MIPEKSPFNASASTQRLLLVCYFAALCALRLVYHHFHYGSVLAEDDAWYYFVIAGNILHHGVSTFDGQSLTNGYHPLWMAVLVLQYATLGSSLLVTLILEIALTAGALYFILKALDEDDFIINALFSILFFKLLSSMALKGMEVSIWTFCFGLMLYLRNRANSLMLGIAAAACIAARIDSVVFVLPFLWLALPTLRLRLQAYAPIVVFGIIYAIGNWLIFGVPFPISGAVKSLGGLQVNHALIEELAAFLHGPQLWKIPFKVLGSLYWLMPIGFLLCAFLLYKTRPNPLGRLLLQTYFFGFILYAVKLMFFSSWAIWPWYDFPLVILLAALFACAPRPASFFTAHRALWHTFLSVAIGLLLIGGLLMYPVAIAKTGVGGTTSFNFARINEMAVQRFGNILKGDRVAMGDRAGSFAAYYNGPLTQLEGLVNDKEYLQLLTTHGDLHALLCRRGVKYFAGYAPDLGDYKTYDAVIIQPMLSSFRSPVLHVTREQEVGRVFDLNVYDGTPNTEFDNYLYLWRMDCR